MIADLEQDQGLTAALNWYRANLPPETWVDPPPTLPPVRCPAMGVWSSGDFALLEPQMTASCSILRRRLPLRAGRGRRPLAATRRSRHHQRLAGRLPYLTGPSGGPTGTIRLCRTGRVDMRGFVSPATPDWAAPFYSPTGLGPLPKTPNRRRNSDRNAARAAPPAWTIARSASKDPPARSASKGFPSLAGASLCLSCPPLRLLPGMSCGSPSWAVSCMAARPAGHATAAGAAGGCPDLRWTARPQVGPMNLAGVLPWIHWRGLVILALLVGGNLFCMTCPFLLPRTLARRWLPAGQLAAAIAE